MQIKYQIISFLILLCFSFNNVASLAINRQQRNSTYPPLNNSLTESSGDISSNLLYGQVHQIDANLSLNQYAPFGFLCAHEGSSELPAKVTVVTLNSEADKQGLKVNDRIIQLHTSKNTVEFLIERASRTYSLVLSIQHLPTTKASINSVIPTSNLHPEIGKADNSTPPKTLYGQVNQLEAPSALNQYAPFGFLCTREGKNELPARVTDVTLNSMAYWQGLRTDDKIFQVHANKNFVKLSIERMGKQYSILLSNEHPFTSLEISRTSLNGIEQTKYADCWFDAGLTALAMTAKGQNLLANMIRQISPTSYYVTFPDQLTESWPINLNTIQHYQLKDNAIWACLIEQAGLLRYSSQHLKGGLMEQGLEALTGTKPQKAVTLVDSDRESEHLPLEKLTQIIDNTLANHGVIVIATKGQRQMQLEDFAEAMKAANIPVKNNGIAVDPNFDYSTLVPLYRASMHKTPIIIWTQHAYTVVSFDRNTNMITLRNPYGTDESSEPAWIATLNMPERKRLVEDLGHGFIRMKLDTLYRYLSKVVWLTF